MIPEISRRCASCGASVRDADALFCAECGEPVPKDHVDFLAETAQALKTDTVWPTENQQEPAGVTEQTASETRGASLEPPTPPPITGGPMEGHPHRLADKTRETLHRASAAASAAARGVIEEPAKRVEKIRHVSTTVIEEASYDPSLRFVLVALGLFLVFIILLVVSKFMG